MEANTANKIYSALQSAEIKEYGILIDEAYHFYNNDNGIITKVGDDFVSIMRKSQVVGAEPYEGETIARMFSSTSIVYFEIGGDFKKIQKFLDEVGATLTDEQKSVLLKIDRTNYNVIPETGDYHPFKELTPEEYDALSDEEKAAYDAAKKEDYAVKNGIHRGFTVRID